MTASTPDEMLTGQDMADAVKFVITAPERMQVHDILIRPTSQLL